MRTSEEHTHWMLRYYKALEGATIEGVTFESDEFDGHILWPTLAVKYADGTMGKVYVQADEEGNSEGFLSGLPIEDEQ